MRPSHQINNSGRLGLSDHSLSSRNSCPMKSISTPGDVNRIAAATRRRLRAYHDRGSFQSASLGMRGLRWSPSMSSKKSWFSVQLEECHAQEKLYGCSSAL